MEYKISFFIGEKLLKVKYKFDFVEKKEVSELFADLLEMRNIN